MAVYHTEEQLEEIGRDLRRRIGLEHQACLDVMTVINKLKHVDPAFNYRRVPDKNMPYAEAEWDSEATVIAMRESVFTGMQRILVLSSSTKFPTTCSGTRGCEIESPVRRCGNIPPLR
jgi:hypothetical protein